ncbi:hypothetical protein JTB14_032479 [Gonioctena quinquepunctata]|nr:hypothetical protein JTB14_032479 [Gonioctena quinquepunctata]
MVGYNLFIPLESSCTISAGGNVSYATVRTQTDQNVSMEIENYFEVRDDISPNTDSDNNDFNQTGNCAERQTFEFNEINNITNVQGRDESSDYEDNIPLSNLIAAEKVKGNEECEICEEAKLHEHKQDNLQEDCEICVKWKRHIEHADKSRKLYQEQARSSFSAGTICVSVDLQKIIMLPRIDTFKKIIFVQRLTTYHESFVPLGKNSNLPPFAVVWNESISGRNKEDIISTFYAFLLSQRDANRIIFWLDNCSSQNKNWCFLTFLVRMVNSNEIAAQELIVYYFEPGHTFMSADSFHHQVELSLKRQGKTYDFDDFLQAVGTSRKSKIDVKSMTHKDFYLWKDFKSQTKLNKDLNHPRLSNIVQIKASRGNYIVQYKTSLTEDEDFKT